MAEITLYATSAPTLDVNPGGTVDVDLGDTERIRFASLGAYDAFMEHLDRQRAAVGYEAAFERDDYQLRVRELSAERRRLRGVES